MLIFFRPTPRPGGFMKIKLEVKEKKDMKLKFDQYKNITSRVEDMEKDKYRIEKTVVQNPIPPTITPIKNLNLPKISQESLFDKCLIENEDNGTFNDLICKTQLLELDHKIVCNDK